MHEHDGGAPLARFQILGQENLVVDLDTVGGMSDHDLRFDMQVRGKARARGGEDDLLRRSRCGRPLRHLPHTQRLRHVPIGA